MTDVIASRLREQSENSAPHEIELPLDVEEADRAADKAINFKLGTTTLSELDQHTRQLKGQVALFADVMRNSADVQGRASWLEAYHLLASGPTRGSLTFNSWLYARDLGRLLRRLVAEYREQSDGVVPVLPTRTPRAALDRFTESRQTYLVPSGLAPTHRPMPFASNR
ncbi:hypothetical protein ACFCZ4_06810 [Streptomyces microflavus]|uniref:hypothetical protein n=1 Tax=Streptomyces microflavus TaxID=1919 RepID=UPI0035DB2040